MRKSNSKCSFCGKNFYKRPAHKEVSNNDYCSKTCYSKAMIKDKNKKCEKCRKVFQYKRRDQRFCSLLCSSKRTRKERTDQISYKHQKRLLFNLLLKQGWDGRCMIDGYNYNKTLDLHRLNNGKDGGKYEEKNIIVVCPNYHAEIHKLKYKTHKIDLFKFNVLKK